MCAKYDQAQQSRVPLILAATGLTCEYGVLVFLFFLGLIFFSSLSALPFYPLFPPPSVFAFSFLLFFSIPPFLPFFPRLPFVSFSNLLWFPTFVFWPFRLSDFFFLQIRFSVFLPPFLCFSFSFSVFLSLFHFLFPAESGAAG